MKNIVSTKIEEVKGEIEEHPKRSVLTIILLFTLIAAFFGALVQHNWVFMLITFVTSILICLPMIIGKLSNIDIPLPLGIFFVLFIYASLFLGELKNYYAAYWWWDMLLHGTAGIAFGIIGFIILYVLYKTEKIKTSPKMVAVFSFAFALTIGVLWEILEFTIDSTLGPISNNVPMQTVVNGCALVDTMKDLIVDAIGALFSAVMGYLYLKRDSWGVLVKLTAKEFKKDNPRFFRKRKK
jgi:uncharacterized membrane protein YjjP (DUF1212 family)